jgi:hypothetical protein
MAELTDFQVAVRELREHAHEHQASETAGCFWCDLWRAYMKRNVRAVDAIIERFELRAPSDDLLDIARKIRADWGEGAWTASDLEEPHE